MSAPESPAPSQTDNAPTGEVKYKFCHECSNLLYAEENRDDSTLLLRCKACHHTEKAETACTYRNHLGSSVAETAGVTTDVGNDPTLPRATIKCPRCAQMEAVYFQSQQRASDTGMKLYYVCLECNFVYNKEHSVAAENKR